MFWLRARRCSAADRAVASAVLEAEGAPGLDLAEVRAFMGNGAPVFVQRMIAARGLSGDVATHARLLDGFLVRYDSALGLTRLYPGAAEALATLSAAGHVLGLCTNKPERPTRAVLAHLGLAETFAAIVCGDTLPTRKPDPAPLRHCLAEMNAPGGFFVGDSEVDAETAARAGLPFVLHTGGYRRAPVSAIVHAAAFDDHAALAPILALLAAPGSAG
ncbi:MAG: phosphoglycolate phosphatase [Alphaproteobacteria bacterium HGW-Alphaproteobacteria-2]|nr:MAG: phosphoglycolate phosphatase [Alphaproteobacteria bacterium HGW-Alphaproteobacteria-2]